MSWRKDMWELHCLQWLDTKAGYSLKLPAIARYILEDVRNLMAIETALSVGPHASNPTLHKDMRTGRIVSRRL
jgi:hypothetical protein